MTIANNKVLDRHPLISVVVPVYKAEKYLNRCIESLLIQTYPNMEIILVDDGSPDSSGQICDNYALNNNNIKVIHKSNGGLSSARNAGLMEVSGDYIGFIDSDDYCDSDMYDYLYQLLRDNNADISECKFRKIITNSEESNNIPFGKEEILCYNNEEAMLELIKDETITSHVTNKLFCRSVLENTFFPVGRVYEDLAVMHEIVSRAVRIVVSSIAKYNYCIRKGSISFTQDINWGYGLFTAFKDRYDFIRMNYPQYLDYAEEKLVGIAIGMYIHWQRFSDRTIIINYEKEVRMCIKEHYSIVNKTNLPVKRKIDAFFIIYLPIFVRLKYKFFYFVKGSHE